MSPLYPVRRYLCWAAFGVFAVFAPIWWVFGGVLSLDSAGMALAVLAAVALAAALPLVLLRAVVGVATGWTPRRADRATAFVVGWFAVGCLVGLGVAACSFAADCSAVGFRSAWRRYTTYYNQWDVLPTVRSMLFVLGGGIALVCAALLVPRRSARALTSPTFLIGVLLLIWWWIAQPVSSAWLVGLAVLLFALWVWVVMLESTRADPRPPLVAPPPSK